mmetsp:Transcript_58203/g.137208  ORF Transcript_58203/g.137208 Transcript_58203/m.137208 type:complete len:223 (-) Transcript_58203:97-765(-)
MVVDLVSVWHVCELLEMHLLSDLRGTSDSICEKVLHLFAAPGSKVGHARERLHGGGSHSEHLRFVPSGVSVEVQQHMYPILIDLDAHLILCLAPEIVPVLTLFRDLLSVLGSVVLGRRIAEGVESPCHVTPEIHHKVAHWVLAKVGGDETHTEFFGRVELPLSEFGYPQTIGKLELSLSQGVLCVEFGDFFDERILDGICLCLKRLEGDLGHVRHLNANVLG